MIITLPSPAAVAGFVAAHPVLVVILVLVAVVVGPAVWSKRPERRCAAAAVLDRLVDGAVAVARVGITAVPWSGPNRPSTA